MAKQVKMRRHEEQLGQPGPTGFKAGILYWVTIGIAGQVRHAQEQTMEHSVRCWGFYFYNSVNFTLFPTRVCVQ